MSTNEEEYNICLTVAMGRNARPHVMALPRNKCHCKGVHTTARGVIDEKKKTISVNPVDYRKFSETHKDKLGALK